MFLVNYATKIMDICFSRNLLLLLTVKIVINTKVYGTLTEPKVQRLVEACLGSDTNISCTVYTDIKELKIKWYFGNTSNFEDQKLIKYSSNQFSVIHYSRDVTSSYLTIRNVAFTNAGWYFCEVTQDIPQLNKQQSIGSELIIYSPTKHNLDYNTIISSTYNASETLNVSPWWIWATSAAGCTMIITTVIIKAVMCGKKKEPPVYENTQQASERHWKEAQFSHHRVISD